MSATLLASRRYRKVAIKALRPDLVFQGVPLDAVIRAHAPLPVPIARDLLLQICTVLQHAHDQGVMHGDVKPASILIDDRGNVQFKDSRIASAAERAPVTRIGLAIGTAEYMSPEECLGHQTSFASDQYSVGLIAYELLTGFPPFIGPPVEVQSAHLRGAPVWVGFARRDCPTPLAAAVMRMLAKEPNERWPALRNAMSLVAMPSRMSSTNARAALAQLVREMETPIRPLPVRAFEIPPRPCAILAVDRSRTRRPSPTLPPIPMPNASPWPRRFAKAAGIAAAILAVAWLEAFTLARRPNDPSIGIARATAGGVTVPRAHAERAGIKASAR